ncbi:MAG: helix-turn-helix domain-containing protein [Saprospiraceae bacterium]
MPDLEANIKVILNSESVAMMLQKLAELTGEQHSTPLNRWIDGKETMELLKISKNTLQKLRDNRAIRFSIPPDVDKCYYDRNSILEYLDKHAKNPE